MTSPIPAADDLRLVVTDMDGTLLSSDAQVPKGLADLVAQMRERGVVFCPASGRQLANIRASLGEIADGPVIAENGTFVVDGEQEISRQLVERDVVRRIIEHSRQLSEQGRGGEVGAVVATPFAAYTDIADPEFLRVTDQYYTSRELVPDLLDLPLDDVIKVAVYDFVDAERLSAPLLAEAAPEVQTVVSGKHWTDLMPVGANKGAALAKLQERLGITPDQTAVFGDYLNDLELMDHAELSFAMANAHPQVKAAARYEAPSNDEAGVVVTVRRLLGL